MVRAEVLCKHRAFERYSEEFDIVAIDGDSDRVDGTNNVHRDDVPGLVHDFLEQLTESDFSFTLG